MNNIKQKDSIINIDHYEKDFEIMLNAFKNAKSFEEQNIQFEILNYHRNAYQASENEARINFFRDMSNTEYNNQHAFFQDSEPRWLKMTAKYYREILKAKFRKQLERKWGNQLFKIAKIKLKTYSDEVQEDIRMENRLVSEYQELLGKAIIPFDEKKLRLSTLASYLESPDRKIRKEAFEAKSIYFKRHASDFDRILDELVKTRNRIAKKLGYSSFVKLGYDRMHRTGHTPEDIVNYHKQVKEHGVQFISALRKKQLKRINISNLKYYDESYFFKNGSPSPIGKHEEFLEIYRFIFHELSSETGRFFDELIEKENIDVESRTNKMGGAFASYSGPEVAPFIFANFNGTSNDVRVFAHEAGHAFQFYMSRHSKILEYIIPYDSCEIFSFTMERFVWPWMELFFGEDTQKYHFSNLTEAFIYMPVVSVVDEFEHFLYEFPTATMQARKQKWRELEHEYLPERDYDGNEFLDKGTGFYEIGHLFTSPFYYIDYDLAHFAAVQLWIKQKDDPKYAWESFLKMCNQGGRLSYPELLKIANLESPFEDGSMERLLEKVKNWIDQVDDDSF
ncbi:M3 family oligoendopeptidase [Psychrobacillus lasiicapitis]|uniref:M3 family oligoendopeptidase n=1 Tax=Psychrobacillus lasiicapitis TaxID=1636719 RepID=A0A544TI27_9BACI|nr:M3 family oligoendopeptidase [Psychrobacillus lasiicapitis]TQR17093.1 M3 family oligoendopeptidase [Psychrobacillus lasiicapitis]GGA24569.1 oligoendopeptidase F [Psychrobacillus lasiicapitis]